MITDTEVAAIVHLRQAFDKPMHELRSALDTLASFPGSCAWAEKKESGTHCACSVPPGASKDGKFSVMLDSVCCGCLTAETFGTLQERLVQGNIADKFIELWKHGQPPVCLFP